MTDEVIQRITDNANALTTARKARKSSSGKTPDELAKPEQIKEFRQVDSQVVRTFFILV